MYFELNGSNVSGSAEILGQTARAVKKCRLRLFTGKTGDVVMNIYTKSGDKGTTDLVRTKNVSKSDDRIQLVGTIDGADKLIWGW